MKKVLSILCFTLIVAAFSSCKKTYVTQASPNQTFFITKQPGDWKLTADGKSDSTSISIPQIDNYFNKVGAPLVYFSYFSGVYEQIPEVYNNVSYSYIHYPGNLVVYIQPTNGVAPTKPTTPITIKLVLVGSN